jgi:uncharacterized protein YceH (UPF0502 family)
MPSPPLVRDTQDMEIGHTDDAAAPLLSFEAARIVGSLIEKQLTVPDSYPLTLNALRSACNQSSNREPVVSFDDGTVLRELDALKTSGFVRFVHASHGARTTRYRQVIDEALDLAPGELAVLSVLLLRGPQTAGELRARTERQHVFDHLNELEATLRALADRPQPLVLLLPREAGRREPRWAQLLSGEPEGGMAAAETASIPSAPTDALVSLRAELVELRERFDELCRRLGEPI